MKQCIDIECEKSHYKYAKCKHSKVIHFIRCENIRGCVLFILTNKFLLDIFSCFLMGVQSFGSTNSISFITNMFLCYTYSTSSSSSDRVLPLA